MMAVGLVLILVFGSWRLWQWRYERDVGPLVLIVGAVILAVVAVMLVARVG
jgi:hypothetical protein